jgi:hypothetical protein
MQENSGLGLKPGGWVPPGMLGEEREGRSLDLLFDCLSDERRRRLVVYMHRSGCDRFTLDRLATALPGDNRRLRTQLHHVHLPKLEEAGVVVYDHDDETVEYRGAPEDVLRLSVMA